MSSLERPESPRYVRVTFDDAEISVIQAACTAVALRDRYLMMADAADADLETASRLAKNAGDSEMAEGLASMFKAGQEILIEPEDLALVLESLKIYGKSPPEDQALAVKNVIEKIKRRCRSA